MRIEIEDNVPLPSARKTGPKPKYPFAEMQPGQSFWIPADPDVPLRRQCQRLISAGVAWAKRHNKPVGFVAQDESSRSGEHRIRCWMTNLKEEAK